MSLFTTSDQIETHTRMSHALTELLIDHFGGQEDHNTLSDDIMSGLMENLSHHLTRIREINADEEERP